MKLRHTQVHVHLVAVSLYVTWHLAFLSAGISALVMDSTISQDKCGQSIGLYRETLLNVLFASFCLVSYIVFPGGGEGARARALMVMIFHFALLAWGIMLWQRLGPCRATLQAKHWLISLFFFVSIVHNSVFTLLHCLHELWIGKALGGDLTIMPELVCTEANLHREDSYASYDPDFAKYSNLPGAASSSSPPPSPPLDDEPPLHTAPELLVNQNDPPSYARSYGEA